MKGRSVPRRGEHIKRTARRRGAKDDATPFMYSRSKWALSSPPLLYNKGLPTDLEGLDDSSLYNGNKEGLDMAAFLETACFAWIPLPGAGSILPHLYVPFVAELFLRSILIVWLLVFLWAVLEIAVYWSIKRFSIPVQWPKKQAVDPETEEEYEYVDYDYLYFMTGLGNPIAGTVGMGMAWYSIRLFNLIPFRDEYDWLLILFLVLFVVIAVHQGKHTAWLSVTFCVPVFILAIMAPVFGAYTRGFSKFAPYLFWLLSNIWFSAWFVRDPFARVGTRFFFSIDGTYAWNAFFSVTIFVLAISLWKVIDLST